MLELLKNKNTILTAALWIVLAIVYLGVYEQDIVYNLHLGSFYCDAKYYIERVTSEDGYLMIVARYLSQFFIYPMFACTILAIVLTALALCIAKITELKSEKIALAFLPSTMAVLLIGVVGSYIHNDIRDVLVMPALGLGYSVLGMWTGKELLKREKSVLFLLGVTAFTVLGFVIGGIFGMFAGVLMSAVALMYSKKVSAVSLVITLVCSALMMWFYSDTRYWLTPLSSMDYTAIPVTEIMIFAAPLVVVFVKMFDNSGREGKLGKYFNLIALALFSGVVFILTERDSAYRGECKLTRQLVNNDFKGMVKTANEIEEPNWACYGLRLIALDQLGAAEEDMFKYTCKRSDFPISYEFHYPWLNLYAGQPLYSLTYAMDYHLFKEENYLNMMVMAYDYILINEKEGAEKALSKMDDNIVYRDWVRKVRKNYSSHIQFAKANPQFGKAMLGAFRENIVIGQIPFEYTFNLSNKMNGKNVSRRVLYALFKKDLEYFKAIMNAVGKDYQGTLPTPIQEAICLCYMKGDTTILDRFPVSPLIGQKANNILKEIQNNKNYEEIQKKYGDSYFTYYFFAVEPNRN